jgi:hypothetical protein
MSGAFASLTASYFSYARNSSNIVIGVDSSPFIVAYNWNSGFGTQYANPTELPPSTPNKIEFDRNGTALAIATTSSPFVSVYVFTLGGFSTKYANPATLPAGGGNGVAFNRTSRGVNSSGSTAIAVAHNNSPFMSAYTWSVFGFGTRFADPATLLPSAGLDVSVGTVSALPSFGALFATATTPFINGYGFGSSSNGLVTSWGTKWADPATLPGGAGTSVAIANAPLTATMTNSGTTAQSLISYRQSGLGAFGTIHTAPATAPTGGGRVVSVAPLGAGGTAQLAVGSVSTPFIQTYPLSNSTGWGTRVAATGTAIPPATPRGVNYGDSGVAMAHTVSPFVTVANTGLTTKFADPLTLPTSAGRSVTWN